MAATPCLKAVISGGNGSLASEIDAIAGRYGIKTVPVGRERMDVSRVADILKVMDEEAPDVFIHCGAMTYPMEMHERYPAESISSNIIGTANVAIQCHARNIKLVYVSTDYVYDGQKGNYSEDDPVLPINTYAKSKLGGEMAVQMIPGSLVLRCALTQRPFRHPAALTDSFKSSLFVDDAAEIVVRLIKAEAEGVINVGGESRSIYDFAREDNANILPISRDDIDTFVPENTTMCKIKMNKVLGQ